MSHCVTGLIAEPGILETFARKHSLHAPVSLNGGLALLPLREEDLDAFLKPPLSDYPEGFNYLASSLVHELMAASRDGCLMYFETEYFGGSGSQGAALFRSGEIAYGPDVSVRHKPAISVSA